MVDKRPIGYMSGKPYFLERKAPRNPKYAHIGPTFISGYNINSIKVLSDRHIVNRKKELFKRIKPSTVANLMRRERHTENIYNLIKNSYSTNVIEEYPGYQAYQGYRPVKPDTRETVNRSEYSSYTSQSKVSNMSKASGLTYGTAQLSLDENTEYIVVDLREKDDYALYHIKEAIHFPGPAIARDKFPKELFAARNRFNTLIIVYHQDEKHSVPYATGLYDKGFENVFLISGGMEAFFEEAPDLIEGRSIPLPLKRNYTSSKSNILYMRSKHMEYPEEGRVRIPSTHLVEGYGDTSFTGTSPSNNKLILTKRSQSIGRYDYSRSKIL